jgi:hypothetical protein
VFAVLAVLAGLTGIDRRELLCLAADAPHDLVGT